MFDLSKQLLETVRTVVGPMQQPAFAGVHYFSTCANSCASDCKAGCKHGCTGCRGKCKGGTKNH